MRVRVVYEWKVEYLDPWGDIEDMDHESSCEKLFKRVNWSVPLEMCLVRDMFEGDDLVGRDHAYFGTTPGGLPATFEGGHVIPRRFRAELRKAKIREIYRDSDGWWIVLRRPWTVDDLTGFREDTKSAAMSRLDEAVSTKPELHD